MKLARSEFIKIIGACALTGKIPTGNSRLFAAPADVLAAPAAGRGWPNVLVILADQWNPYCLGFAGATDVKTPNLDALAREGAFFSACYTTSPVCMPARTGLISGQYPHNLCLWNNAVNYYVRPEQARLFADMKQAGYETAQLGKLHWFTGNRYKDEFPDLNTYFKALGLDVGESMLCEGGGTFGKHVRDIGKWDEYLHDFRQRLLNDEYAPLPSVLAPEDQCDSITASRAIEHIQTRPPGQPWFVVVSFNGPHPPLDAPGGYATMYDPATVELPRSFVAPMKYNGKEYSAEDLRRSKANYLGKMSLIDDRIGEIIAALKKRGAWENTLVVFAADHGEMMGAHNYMSKCKFYEESARVPLIVRWPGVAAPGTKVEAPVQLFDIYPTVVEAAGGVVTPGHFAKSLTPLLRGAKETRPAVFSEISDIGGNDAFCYLIRTQRYKWFKEYDAKNREHLYDIQVDPLEMKNLAAVPAYKDETQAMHARLLDFLATTDVNYSAGYKPQPQRMREQQAETGKGN